MEFRILGPLEVVDDGRPISIRRGKEQALLAYLLLHANEVVPSERLIDELWGERPPPTAPKILQNAVSHLRKELGDGRLVTSGRGYVLRVGEEELDLQKFERLAREGRNDEALALWRGPALVNLHDERFADDARRRLEDERLAVVEDRIDADLAAGRHPETVGELEDLIAAHPLRERLYSQLMLALYRDGRQADALETYQRARRTLSAELGLEPGPQLQELERKILTQDPTLAAPPSARRPVRPVARGRRRLGLFALAGALLLAAAIVGAIYAFSGDETALVVKKNSLAVIDPNGNRLVDVIPVGTTPRGVAVGSASVWVTNATDGTLSEIDVKSHKVVQTIGIGAQASDVVEASGGVWVATGLDNSLVRVDARSGGVLGSLPLSRELASSAHAVTAGRGAIWVTSGDRLFEIDPRSGAVLAGGRPLGCCYELYDVAVDEHAVWLVDLSEHVTRLSPASVRRTGSISLGVIPTTVATGFGSVWAAAPESTGGRVALWRLDPQTVRVTQTIPVGRGNAYLETLGLAVGAGSIWLTKYDEGTLFRIDPTSGTVEATIHIGGHPRGIAVGAGRVWVTID
jgi:DNA-binding SARP family transcriptional activator/DNA-binding beta-propeller fold protein YncE